MKSKQLIIVVLLALSLGILVFFFVDKSDNSTKTPENDDKNISFSTKIVKNTIAEYDLTARGEICKDPELNIIFEVSGILINGDSILTPGTQFKQNQLLYRINNDEAFSQLAIKKSELIKQFSAILPQLELKFPTEKNKWLEFMDNIKPSKLLPEYPTLFTPSERIFLIEKGFIQAFVKAKMQEKQMEKYFYLAPFDGTFLESRIAPGEMVTAGASVALISEHAPLTAKIIVPKTDIQLYRQQNHVHFTTKKGHIIANGTYLRSSNKSKRSNSSEVFYSVQSNPKSKINPEDKITITTHHYTYQKCVSLPYAALNVNKVKVMVNGQPVKKTVKIIAKNPYHYFVTGLNDGDEVILKW